MKIYLASSWRNVYQEIILDLLRDAGHEVYDFKNEEYSFHWSQIDPGWKDWTPDQYAAGLKHNKAVAGFIQDFDAMAHADLCVMLLPCGRSSHLEAGWFAGQQRPVIIHTVDPEALEPELMYKLATTITCGDKALLDAIDWLVKANK